jgi:RimJ/RimL family protein N-acetyltransferase
MVPQNNAWSELIEKNYGTKARKVTRYAIKKETDVFDREMFKNVVHALSPEYTLKMIDEDMFYMCKSNDWSRDLVSQYKDYNTYKKLGLGVVVLKGGELISGASSYTRYQDGIEIEIDTRQEHRRKGLAYACAAKLILECLDRNLYPSWDAQNKGSVALAEKLGYHYDHEYDAYEIWKY